MKYTHPLVGSNLIFLETFNVQDCQLEGDFPVELYLLSQLEEVRVNGNAFMQDHPLTANEFTRWPNLQVLYWGDSQVANNKIPTELFELSMLESLFLENARLVGSLPTQLGLLTTLRELSLKGNALTGAVPTEWNDLVNLGESVP